ncbi:hypothetical protein [Chitinophaga sp. GbtcB8]|uniref:hypothetical protein n=1 Tax=Chitinophaga sp. GbtcB8 TaxID=2824753 RepID=UPI001C2FCC40|nr:hypothetical protein [Chitinophaga sp. GbtcB8]
MYTEKRLIEKAAVESGIDTDWYFIDMFGKMAVVASAGGLLPDPVVADMNRLEKMIAYFRALPVLSNNIIIEKHILDKVEKYTKEQRETYLKDLYFMVSRGFYYFDKTELNNYFDFKYELKAKPSIPLIINNNDSSVQEILPNIVVGKDIEDIKFFFVNDFA